MSIKIGINDGTMFQSNDVYTAFLPRTIRLIGAKYDADVPCSRNNLNNGIRPAHPILVLMTSHRLH